MSYEFIKLSEVEVIETSTTANLLIEEDGEIKRLPASNFNTTPNVQADWNETDDTSPAYIANKPESLGGGAETIVFYSNSGIITNRKTGEEITREYITNKYNEGANLIWEQGSYLCKPICVKFGYDSNIGQELIDSLLVAYTPDNIFEVYIS